MYQEIYTSMCEKNRANVKFYAHGSGLHRHHIVPRHQGGIDDESNVTYVSVRVHIALHFLLWKIHKNPNDLRSMHMLGAKLSVAQRRITGEFCRDNKIGIFADKWKTDTDAHKRLHRKTYETSKLRHSGMFDPDLLHKRAVAGGKAGGKATYELHVGIHNPGKIIENASKGGKALKGMIKVHNEQNIETMIHPEDLNEYLKNGWIRGGKKRDTRLKWIQKDGEYKIVKITEVDAFVTNGWTLGSFQRLVGRRCITKDGVYRVVDENSVNSYLEDGWKLGRRKREKQPFKLFWMYKDSVFTRVRDNKVQEYVNDGWIMKGHPGQKGPRKPYGPRKHASVLSEP